MAKMLIVVDPQIDFISGSLPVPGAQAAMNALTEYLLENGHDYACKVVTCDWHPHDHCSFTENGGQWPRHCEQHTEGAAIYAPIVDALYASDGPVEILTKGDVSAKEEYSVFQNPASAKKIEELAQRWHVTEIDICGLAGDVCVANTYEDACRVFPQDTIKVLDKFSPKLSA